MPAKGLSKYTGLLPVYCSEELKAAYVVNRQDTRTERRVLSASGVLISTLTTS